MLSCGRPSWPFFDEVEKKEGLNLGLGLLTEHALGRKFTVASTLAHVPPFELAAMTPVSVNRHSLMVLRTVNGLSNTQNL